MKNILKKKNIVLSIIVIFMGLAIAGGTFAWLTGTLTVNNGNYTAVSDCFLIDYNTSELENNRQNNIINRITAPADNNTDLGNGVFQVDYTQSTADNYMYIYTNVDVINGKTYVLEFNVDGLANDVSISFGFYYKKNGTNGVWHKQSFVNGLNKFVFTYEGPTATKFTFDDSTRTGNPVFTMSNFYLYEQSQDITGTMFPSSNVSKGLNGHVGLKVNSSCNTYGTGTIKLHVDSTTSSTLTTPIASYCESKKTLQKIDGISTKAACETANGIWRGYGDSYCENPDTLERITTYTTQSDCTSNGGSWTTGGSPLKYAVYNTDDITQNPISVGHINTSDIGHDVPLKDDIVISEAQKYFYIYIWLDGYMTDNRFSNLPFSGSILASAIQNNGGVPSGYQRVEFLKKPTVSDPTTGPYINTGIVPSSNFEYLIKYQDIAANGSNYVMGSRSGSSETIYQGVSGTNSNKEIGVAKNSVSTPNNYRKKNYIYEIHATYNDDITGTSTIKCLNTGDIFTGNQLSSSAGATANVMVFAMRNNQRHLGMALYTLKIWDNSVLVRDFIPCYNKTTLVMGLYDTVNDTFYTNAGNGTFEIGPEI